MNLKWNCFWIQQKRFFFKLISAFEIDVTFIHIINIVVYSREIVCDDVWCKFLQSSSQKTRRCYVFCSLFIAFENFHYTRRNWLKIVESFICCIVCKINQLFQINFYWINTRFLQSYQMLIKFVTFAIYVEFDWIFVNFIEYEFLLSSWFWIALYLCDFAFVRFFDRVFLLKSTFDFLKMFLIFWFLMFCNKNKMIESLLYDLNIENSFCIEVLDQLRLLFQSF